MAATKGSMTLVTEEFEVKAQVAYPHKTSGKDYTVVVIKDGEAEDILCSFNVRYTRAPIRGQGIKTVHSVIVDGSLDDIDAHPKAASYVLQLIMHVMPDHVDALMIYPGENNNKLAVLIAAAGGSEVPLSTKTNLTMWDKSAEAEIKKHIDDMFFIEAKKL